MKKGHNASMRKAQKKRRPGRLVARIGIAVIALGATVGIAACGSSGSSLSLVAYSTPQQVYEQSLEPGFKNTSDGKDVDFSNSFGASGDQSRAVESGQPADVVEFSLQPDMQRLVDAGIVSADWDKNQYKGIVTNSVVTLMVRPGNPKHITSFDDLANSGVDVIDPNPATSGGARWNIMAIYGSQIAEGKTPAQAQAFVKQVLANTSVQDSSARDSLNTFSSGKGDVLVGYENDAIQAKKDGIDLEYVTPPSTILIENPIAVVSKSKHLAQAKAFVAYTRSPTAQRIFGKLGYRPIVPAIAKEFSFPKPAGLFTIQKFGGWSTVNKQFFDPATGSIAKVEQSAGVSTGG